MNSNKTTKVSTKQRTTPFGNVLLAAVKNGRFKEWFYEWKHGHPRLLTEEVDIICKTREEPRLKHLNDREIQTVIQIRISDMYERKYPNAKRWSLAHF